MKVDTKIDAKTSEVLQREALLDDRPVSAVIRRAIREYLVRAGHGLELDG